MGYIKDIAINKNRILNHSKLIKEQIDILEGSSFKKRLLGRGGHIELQLTDRCVLNCSNCHFRGLGDKHFSFEWLDNIITHIRPRAITLAGGGEPTIYSRFNDAVLKLSKIPKVKIGLITNGVVYPDGCWKKHIDWVRISLYSLEDGKYSGRPETLRYTVLRNIEKYLCESGIANIGIHFLFYGKNMADIVPSAKEIYHRFRGDRKNFEKIHIQFKPAFIMARPSILTPELHKENVRLLPKREQIKSALLEFDHEFSLDEKFGEFIRFQSNYDIFDQLLSGYLDELTSVTDPENFLGKSEGKEKCYVCLAYRLIDPSGNIYPCLTLAEHRLKKFSLGHITDLPNIDIDRLRVFYETETECCNASFCRNWSQNKIVREYLKSSSRVEFPNDCFF